MVTFLLPLFFNLLNVPPLTPQKHKVVDITTMAKNPPLVQCFPFSYTIHNRNQNTHSLIHSKLHRQTHTQRERAILYPRLKSSSEGRMIERVTHRIQQKLRVSMVTRFQQSKSVTHVGSNVLALAYWKESVESCRIYWNIEKMDPWYNQFQAGYACVF